MGDATTIFVDESDRITYVDDPEIRKLLERTDVEDRKSSIPKKLYSYPVSKIRQIVSEKRSKGK